MVWLVPMVWLHSGAVRLEVTLYEYQRVGRVSSATTTVLLPLLKKHSFFLSLGPLENTAAQTNPVTLQTLMGATEWLLDPLPWMQPQIPGDEYQVLWHSFVSLGVYQPAGSASVFLCSRLPSREAPAFLSGREQGSNTCL